ncbi:MAG: hypothetical protein MJ189_02160, partial [Coriobacteriales bacterium]|nr:hypothetical protein [Coriobacteriales bacterium]
LENTVQKYGLYKTAALQGKIAGTNIAAELSDTNQKLQKCPDVIPYNLITIQNVLLITAGNINFADNDTCEISQFSWGLSACKYIDGKLVGFNVVSDNSNHGSAAYDYAATLYNKISNQFAD